MKKFLPPILSLMLLCSIAGAQNLNHDFYDFVNSFNTEGKQAPSPQYRKNGVREVTTKGFTKNNSGKFEYKIYYTPYGTWAGYEAIKKGRGVRSNILHYIDSSHYDKLYITRKGDTALFQYQYDVHMNVVRITATYHGKPGKNYSQYTYNDKNLVTSMVMFNKDKKIMHYEYDYFDNGSKKQTRYYNGKGKLKQVWNYTCTQQGDLAKSVVQTSYCKKRDYNTDGSYYETFEGSDQKGHTRRRVDKYSKDSLLLEQTDYNSRGKEIFKRTSEYDSQRNEVKGTYYRHGKLHDTLYYTYNNKGLAATVKETTANGKEYDKEFNYLYY